MHKVITVSLNGNAFQLEDDAYGVLATYLDQSALALAANPDRTEIMADLEQAVADKCAAFLSPHKGVITRSEIESVITQMGPVDSDVAGSSGAASAGSNANSDQTRPAGEATARRLYQISEGAMVSGICNGYAAYSGIDVTWIRVIFVLLILVTFGLGVLAYLVLMFIIPFAHTSEEHAAAHGIPFNARLLVEQAKRHYAQFAAAGHVHAPDEKWCSEWRRARAEHRLERRRAREQWRQYRRYGRGFGFQAPPPAAAMAASTPGSYAGHVISGSLLAIMGLVLAAMGIVLMLAVISLINDRAILGWSLPQDIPLWAGLIGLIVVYNFVAWPIKAMRHSAWWYAGNHGGPWLGVWDAVVGLAVAAFVVQYGLHHMPQIQEFFEHLPRLWQDSNWSQTAARLSLRA